MSTSPSSRQRSPHKQLSVLDSESGTWVSLTEHAVGAEAVPCPNRESGGSMFMDDVPAPFSRRPSCSVTTIKVQSSDVPDQPTATTDNTHHSAPAGDSATLPAPTRLKHYDTLTSLRGLAALCVWFCHAGHYSYLDYTYQELGRVAVTCFFVLSGCVMTLTYQHCRFESPACYRSFYLKRAARICPLYFLCLLLNKDDYSCIWTQTCNMYNIVPLVLSPLTLQSWVPCGFDQWGLVTWSISVETFSYLMFPYMQRRLLHRHNPGGHDQGSVDLWLTYMSIISCCLAVTSVPTYFTAAIGWDVFHTVSCALTALPLLRICDFAVGMLIPPLMDVHLSVRVSSDYSASHWWHRLMLRTYSNLSHLPLVVRRDIPFVVFAVIILVSTAFSEPFGYYIATGNITTLFTALMIYMLMQHQESGAFAMLLKAPFPQHLGEISYAFYLFHLCVHRYFVEAGVSPTDSGMLDGTFLIVWLLTSIGAASMLHYALENPVYQYIVTQSQQRSQWACYCRKFKAVASDADVTPIKPMVGRVDSTCEHSDGTFVG